MGWARLQHPPACMCAAFNIRPDRARLQHPLVLMRTRIHMGQDRPQNLPVHIRDRCEGDSGWVRLQHPPVRAGTGVGQAGEAGAVNGGTGSWPHQAMHSTYQHT